MLYSVIAKLMLYTVIARVMLYSVIARVMLYTVIARKALPDVAILFTLYVMLSEVEASPQSRQETMLIEYCHRGDSSLRSE